MLPLDVRVSLALVLALCESRALAVTLALEDARRDPRADALEDGLPLCVSVARVDAVSVAVPLDERDKTAVALLVRRPLRVVAAVLDTVTVPDNAGDSLSTLERDDVAIAESEPLRVLTGLVVLVRKTVLLSLELLVALFDCKLDALRDDDADTLPLMRAVTDDESDGAELALTEGLLIGDELINALRVALGDDDNERVATEERESAADDDNVAVA